MTAATAEGADVPAPGPVRPVRMAAASVGAAVLVAGARRLVDTVTVVGLATGYCVEHTALDALREGHGVTVDPSATAGVDAHPGDVERALDELSRADGVVIGQPVR